MSNVNLVCPNCGCETFTRKEVTVQDVYVTGNGEFQHSADNPDTQHIYGAYRCIDCKEEYASQEQLVTEEHFHEVIAPQIQP